MHIFIIFTSCLLYTLSSGQTNITSNNPALGLVYPVPNNDSLLNFTFIYPKYFTFDRLFVRFTLYDFIENNKSNPKTYPFAWVNFTNSNTSLAWVVPPITLQPSDYIIACFEWVQTNYNNQTIADTNECMLTRTSMNSALLSIANPMISNPIIMNTTITISAYYPAILPYDEVNITSTLNDTTLPSMTYSSSNDTYMNIDTFSYMNLSSNTYYNICIYINYENSKINGTQNSNIQCQMIMTLGDYLSTITTGITTSANTTRMTASATTFNKVISNLSLIILLFMFYFI